MIFALLNGFFLFLRANEVCEGYVFTLVCQSFCSQGGVPGQVHPPDQVHPPGPGTPPRIRYPPRHIHPLEPGTTTQDEVHHPGRYPRDQVHPHGQIHPQAGSPPRTRYPSEQCMLGDTSNKRAVRILLECILVYIVMTAWLYAKTVKMGVGLPKILFTCKL